MSTRLYLSAATAADVSPAFDSGTHSVFAWDSTSGADRAKLLRAKNGEALTDGPLTGGSNPGGAGVKKRFLLRQYVSDPLAAQTIAGDFSGFAIAYRHGGPDVGHYPALKIYVVSKDGSTVRGDLFAGACGTQSQSCWNKDVTDFPEDWSSEFLATAPSGPHANAQPVALSSVGALAGDRVVLEIGWVFLYGGNPGPAYCHLRVGASNTADISAELQIDKTPWIEFSQDLVFGPSIDFATAAQERQEKLFSCITIESIGTSTGLDRFCTSVPHYAIGDPMYKAWLVDGSMPDHLGESINPLGGVAECGSFAFELTDGVGTPGDPWYDYLTKAIGSDSAEDLELDAAVAVGDTTISLIGDAAKISALATGKILYLGAEAVAITVVTPTSSTTANVTVTRAVLDTDAAAHKLFDSVYFATPYVHGRRLRVYLGFDDPGADASIETEIGPGWVVDHYELSRGLQAYSFSAISSIGFLDRQIARTYFRARLDRIDGADSRSLALTRSEGSPDWLTVFYFDGENWAKHGDEIIILRFPNSTSIASDFQVLQDSRGMLGTPVQDFAVGEEVRYVLVAEPRTGHGPNGAQGSFRFQPPGLEDGSNRTFDWQVTDHPIPIALCLMLSSASRDDGLELFNFVAGDGNFSSLPIGFGAGIPVSRVNVQSALGIWTQHPEWHLPNLVVEKSESLREFLDREICRPFGIVITVQGGLITFLKGDIISVAGTGDAWTKNDVILELEEDGRYTWQMEQVKADDLAAATVTFAAKNLSGVESTITFKDSNFAEVFGRISSNYKMDGGDIKIPVPGARFDGSGTDAFFEKRAFAILLNFRRPPWKIPLSTDMSKVLIDVFSVILFSHPELVDDVNRRRGWNSIACRVIAKEYDFENAVIHWTLLSYFHAGKIGLVSPAAVITAVASNTITAAANRFTDADVPTGLGLPTSDVAAFAVGDVVRLRSFDGTVVATTPATQIVQVITPGANTIQLDGNFGGALAAGKILVYATYDSEVTQQKSTFVSLADDFAKLGTAKDPAFTYGDS